MWYWILNIVSSWWTAVAVLQICWAFSSLFPLVSQFDVGIVALKLFRRFRFEQGVGDQTSPVKTRHVQNHILSSKKSSESYFNVGFSFVTFDCPATLSEAILSDPLSWIWPEESLTPWNRRLVHRNSPSVYPHSSLSASDDWTWNWIYSWPAQTRGSLRVVASRTIWSFPLAFCYSIEFKNIAKSIVV